MTTTATTIPAHFTDAALEASAVEYRAGGRNGFSRAAHYLLTVPAEARQAVVTDATLATNLSGGRYADNVSSAAARWQGCLAKALDGTHTRLAHGTYAEPNLPGSGG